ncbi:MAG TPA: PAS domain S-box protein [Oculatellaceae cyanobacterium]|jgi:PAS domain S-box-containing protein
MQDSTAKLQAGMSITPTASADEINEPTQQTVLLNRIVFDIRNTLIVDEILQKTVDSLHQALNLSGCASFQPNSSNLLKVSHVSVATVHGEKLIGTTSKIYTDYYQALSQGETVVIENIEASLALEIQSADIADGISRLILVPLVYEQKYLGGISLFQFDLKREWTTKELYFVEAIAQHCAVALYQAKLYQKAQTEIAQRQQSETLLLQTTSELHSLFQVFPDIYFRLASDGTILSYHAGASVELYVAPEKFLNKRLQDVLPENVGDQCYKAFLQVLETNSLVAVEYSLPLPSGEKNFEARFLPSQDQQVIVIVREITQRKQIELALQAAKEQLEIKVTERTAQLTNANAQLQTEISEHQWTANLLAGQNRIMEMIAKGASLRSCLNVIAQFIEKQSGEVACAIALLAENGINLKSYIAPSLPKNYLQSLKLLGISPNFASCDIGDCYRQTVIVSDIATDPKWQNFRNLGLSNGLRACFSTPILATSGDVLGILELYYRTPRPPNLSDRKLVDIFTQIAGIAIERQRVEESRQRSKQRFQNLVETTSDWVWEVNENAVYTYVSPKIRDLLGYEPEEILGKTPFDLMPAEEAKRIANTFSAVFTAQQPISGLENTNLHKNGHQVILETSGVPIFDADGNFRGYRGIDRDITERKQAEEALRISENRLRAIIDAEPECVKLVAADGTLLEINPAGRAMIEADNAEAVIGKSVYDLVAPEYRQAYQALNERVCQGNKGKLEVEFIGCKGKRIWMETHAVPLRNEADGSLIQLAIARDITERKQTEQALKESEEKFRNLVEYTNDWVWASNLDGLFTYVNPKVRDILGYEPQEIIGKTVYELMSVDEANRFAEVLQPFISNGEPFNNLEKTLIHKNGHRVILESSGSPVCDRQGILQGYRGITRDITERKHAEQEMVKALEKEKELSELKSSFVSMTSHEFRTPMSTILSSSELLEHYHNKFTEEKRLAHLHRIQSAIHQMTQLLNDVLTIGRAEARQLKFQPELLDLENFCQKFTEEMQLSIGNSHKIIFSKQGKNRPTYMDEKLLRHIFSNLLSNAVKYSPQGSTIFWKLDFESVRAATPVESRAIFQVQDQGIGIPETDQKRLFDSFFRGTNVGMIPGTGLGLAILKNCVDLHGGEISLSSQVGVGTTFTVILPLHYEASLERNPQIYEDQDYGIV